MIHIKDKQQCCGCTSCYAICPQECISMHEDHEGFLYPSVDESKCVGCHLCEEVCPIMNAKKEQAFPQRAFVVQHKDETILRESTSGGAFSAIAKWVLDRKGIVYGAGYDETFEVKHFSIRSESDLYKFRNSKYSQSHKTNCFKEIKKELSTGVIVLFSGTPCEVEGLLSFLGTSFPNLITIDVVCHAVPSPLLFRKYLEAQRGERGEGIVDVKFREKHYGYSYSTMTIRWANKKVYHQGIDTDVMLRAYFDSIASRPSCYHCAFKKRYRMSDFTLWDCFVADEFCRELDNEKGVTRVLLHTEKAIRIFDDIRDDVFYKEVSPDHLTYKVKEMFQSVNANSLRDAFFSDLNNMRAEDCFRKYYPITMRNKVEKGVRLFFVKVGIYKYFKRTVKKLIGDRTIKR